MQLSFFFLFKFLRVLETKREILENTFSVFTQIVTQLFKRKFLLRSNIRLIYRTLQGFRQNKKYRKQSFGNYLRLTVYISQRETHKTVKQENDIKAILFVQDVVLNQTVLPMVENQIMYLVNPGLCTLRICCVSIHCTIFNNIT